MEIMDSFISHFTKNLPHIAIQIFGSLDRDTLRSCSEVCVSWHEFLEKEKFYWTKITKGHKGWGKVIKLLDSDKLCALGNEFLNLWRKFAFEYIFFGDSGKTPRQQRHPLLCAISLDDLEIFKIVIETCPALHIVLTDFDILISNQYGSRYGPLEFAAFNGRLQIVKEFLQRMVEDENCSEIIGEECNFALITASVHGYHDVAKELLKHSKDKNPMGTNKRTALHFAAKANHLEVVKVLLDKIEDEKDPMDDYGRSPLHEAALNGNLEMVKVLLPHSIFLNMPDRDGRTPIGEASRGGHWNIIKLIMNELNGDKSPKENAKKLKSS